MGQTDVRCSACGYDFPENPKMNVRESGFAHSALAEVVLVIAAFLTGIACALLVLVWPFSIFLLPWYYPAFVLPVAFFQFLVQYIVLVRVMT